jgi:uncharacterized protein
MSREFPDWVDPWKAADGRRGYGGTMPLKRLPRLVPLLAPAEAGAAWQDARFSAAFSHDRQGTVVVDIRVQANLPLVCQRSLEPYLEPVERRSWLAVVESVAEQDEVPEHYEPVLVEKGRLALQDLVEDELLLALPQVPRNPETSAVQRSTGGDGGGSGDGRRETGPEDAGGSSASGDTHGDRTSDEPTHRPFEGLADLMKVRK